MTGIFGARAAAVDAGTGSVNAGTLAGWSCSASSGIVQFDGSYDFVHLPVGHSYVLYAEPLVGLVAPGDCSETTNNLCASNGAAPCTVPAVNLNFNVQILPASP